MYVLRVSGRTVTDTKHVHTSRHEKPCRTTEDWSRPPCDRVKTILAPRKPVGYSRMREHHTFDGRCYTSAELSAAVERERSQLAVELSRLNRRQRQIMQRLEELDTAATLLERD